MSRRAFLVIVTALTAPVFTGCASFVGQHRTERVYSMSAAQLETATEDLLEQENWIVYPQAEGDEDQTVAVHPGRAGHETSVRLRYEDVEGGSKATATGYSGASWNWATFGIYGRMTRTQALQEFKGFCEKLDGM